MQIFAAAFLKYFPEHKISEIHSQIIHELFEYTETMIGSEAEKRPTGIFFGESSIVYGYELLYRITENPIFLDYAAKHCRIVERYLENDDQFDIVGGNAGAIMAFLNLYDLRTEPYYLKMAEKAGELLLENSVTTGQGIGWKSISNGALLGGFAHGCAGIMYALARLAFYTGNRTYLNAAYQAFLYERTLYSPEKGGWRDLRVEEEQYMNDFKWCHGAAGILLGWKCSLKYFDGEEKDRLSGEIRRLSADYPEVHPKEELGLCHGNLGNAMIGQFAEMTLWKTSLQKNTDRSRQILSQILFENEKKAGLHEQYDYSLMTGLSGIGYGLLYNLDSSLPGILDMKI